MEIHSAVFKLIEADGGTEIFCAPQGCQLSTGGKYIGGAREEASVFCLRYRNPDFSWGDLSKITRNLKSE